MAEHIGLLNQSLLVQLAPSLEIPETIDSNSRKAPLVSKTFLDTHFSLSEEFLQQNLTAEVPYEPDDDAAGPVDHDISPNLSPPAPPNILDGSNGTLISIAFGVLGLAAAGYFYAYPRTVRPKLVFGFEISLGLFESVARDLSSIEIRYNGEPIARNLVLIRGVLLNLGRADVLSQLGSSPVTLSLPLGYEWREVAVVSNSRDMVVECDIAEPTKITVSTPMHRVSEFIRIQALAEVPEQEENGGRALQRELRIDHRLADTPKARIDTSLPQSPPVRRDLVRKVLISMGVVLGLVAIIVAGLVWNFFSERFERALVAVFVTISFPVLASLLEPVNHYRRAKKLPDDYWRSR